MIFCIVALYMHNAFFNGANLGIYVMITRPLISLIEYVPNNL